MSPQMEGRLTDSRRREGVGGTYLASPGSDVAVAPESGRGKERRGGTQGSQGEKNNNAQAALYGCITSSRVHLGFTPSFVSP